MKRQANFCSDFSLDMMGASLSLEIQLANCPKHTLETADSVSPPVRRKCAWNTTVLFDQSMGMSEIVTAIWTIFVCLQIPSYSLIQFDQESKNRPQFFLDRSWLCLRRWGCLGNFVSYSTITLPESRGDIPLPCWCVREIGEWFRINHSKRRNRIASIVPLSCRLQEWVTASLGIDKL